MAALEPDATLRSNGWEGPAPCVGDLVRGRGGHWWRVLHAAAGPAPGHYRLDVALLDGPPEDERHVNVFAWRKPNL